MKTLSLWKRSLALLGALSMAMILAVPQPAQALVVNNGMIVVHNDTGYHVSFLLDFVRGHTIVHVRDLPPGSTYRTQACCFAAGTEYSFDAYARPKLELFKKIRPHLCNRNGIPYGYEELRITMERITPNADLNHMVVHIVNPHGCYEVG